MIPFIILGAIGLILAVLLVVASKYLHIEESKSLETVTRLLPGYNCGACGYPGCSGFAQAILEGKVDKLSTCKPGKENLNFVPILEFLKQEDESLLVKLKIK